MIEVGNAVVSGEFMSALPEAGSSGQLCYTFMWDRRQSLCRWHCYHDLSGPQLIK